MKKRTFTHRIVVLIALLPLVYLALVWNRLPSIVAAHFGADFKPDRYGDKTEVLLAAVLLALASIGVYFLLNNLHRFDPKRKGSGTSSSFHKLGFGLVLFMAALNVIIIESAKGTLQIQNFLFPLLGLMFAFLGNYMNNIKPNYFAGIRLPWTLSNDENWRRTHQLAGRLWFAGGLLIAIVGVLLSPASFLPVFISLLVVMVVVPVIYSYRLFKHQN